VEDFMPKIFYTERDIEDLAKRGVHMLDVNDEVVLTELAYEQAERLGVKLLRPNMVPPAAPVRPYIAKEQQSASMTVKPAPSCGVAKECGCSSSPSSELKDRVRNAVIAKLGSQVDNTLLDSIITRVLGNLGAR
jgi:hypothetical protein